MTITSALPSPALSVVMAARNAEPYLAKALESLQRQTMPAFEAIVVEDGSIDGTRQIAEAHAARDPRFRVLVNERNAGLAVSLNRAIEAARGPLLARFDADDVAMPDRFEVQMKCFEGDAGLVLLGSNVDYVDSGGRSIDRSELPLDDGTIRCCALLFNPFAHPAVMMRADPFRNSGLRYDPSFETTQDWDLWTRLFAHGTVANLKRALVQLRLNPGSVSATRKPLQLDNSIRIQQRYMRQFLGSCDYSVEDLTLLSKGFLGDRDGADREGWDRVRACHLALDLMCRAAAASDPHRVAGFERYVVRRAVRMGLVPPLRPGWVGLLGRLLHSAPVATVGAAFEHLRRWGGGGSCN